MATMLRLTIQAAWAYVGAMACWLTFSLSGHILSQIFRGSLFRNGVLWLLFPMLALILWIGLLGSLMYGAWIALFRFSSGILGPTCLLVSLVLVHFANEAGDRFIRTFLNPHVGIHLAAPFVGLLLEIVVIAGWICFFRAMPKVLVRFLFPDLSSAAQTTL